MVIALGNTSSPRMLCALCMSLLSGCLSLDQEVAGLGELQLQHYRRMAADIDYPDPDEAIRRVPVLGNSRDLKPPENVPSRPLMLAEAVRLGLQNNQVIRQNAQFLSQSNSLLDNPDMAASIFDVDIQNNGVIFGSRGVPAAVSDYDPHFMTSLQYGRDATVPNSIFQSEGLPLGATLLQNTGQLQSRLEQPLTTGGTMSLVHNWNYLDSNSPDQLFPSAYTGALGVELRQPLWAGAGEKYTAIAGPLGQRARGFSYVNQGVVIAQLNNQISQYDFSANLQNLVRDIGDLYWDLYLAYEEYEAEVEVRNNSRRSWDEAKTKLQAGIEGGAAADEAQAADVYYDSEARTEAALSNIYQTETRFRRLLGMPVDDGQLVRPCDEPLKVDIHPDRFNYLIDAYANRVELKRQKTNIESLRLQCEAALSLINPRVDFVGGYRLNGFGQNLYAQNQSDGVTDQGYNSAYGSLFRGSQTGWEVGIEVNVPIFLRSERAQLRQLEFKLSKARVALEEQELEIAHELTYSFQALQRWLANAESNRQRQLATLRRVDAARADYEAGRASLDLLLRAQVSHAQAVVAYQRSLTEYNKSLWDLDFRAGTILARNNIHLQDVTLKEATLLSGL